ncbi:MAG TPA: hypothetical protein VNV65_11145 [Candidatus Solibacter sp.]|nr:hypothetical protein [Candidatus Solibacter sp.]
MPDSSNPPDGKAAMAAARRRLTHLKLTAAAASVLALGGLTQVVAAEVGSTAAVTGATSNATGSTATSAQTSDGGSSASSDSSSSAAASSGTAGSGTTGSGSGSPQPAPPVVSAQS